MNKIKLISDLQKISHLCKDIDIQDLIKNEQSIYFEDVVMSDDFCNFHSDGKIYHIINETHDLFGFTCENLILMCGFDEMHGSGIIILGNNETILETKMICDGYSQDEEECLVREIINNCLTYGFPIVIKPDRNLSHEGILYKHGKQFYFPKYKKTEYKEFKMYLPIKNNKGVKIKDKMIVLTDYDVDDDKIIVHDFFKE